VYIEPISVPYAVKQVIGSNGLFIQALRTGIANYTAMASKIKADVEKLTKAPVNLNTLVVAIKRFADSLQHEKITTLAINGIRMSLTGSIVDVGFSSVSREVVRVLDELIDSDKDYSLFRTNKQVKLFAEDLDEVRTIFGLENFQGIIKEGLSKITITMPSGLQNTYSILSMVSYILSINQIPVYNAFFSHDQIILILNVDDAARAYEMIRERITSYSC